MLANCFIPAARPEPTAFYLGIVRRENGKEWVLADNCLWYDLAAMREFTRQETSEAQQMRLLLP